MKSVAVIRKAAIWFEKTRFIYGDFRTRWSGMIGVMAYVSTNKKSGKRIAKIIRDAMTRG